MSEHIVVTCKVDKTKREIIEAGLKNYGELDFIFHENQNERQRALKSADIILAWHPAKEFGDNFDLLEKARFMQLLSAGADHVPFENIPANITIACNAGAYGEPMAEHVVAMTLTLSKRLIEEHENMKRGEFNMFGKPNKYIKDSTIGILGFGGIGKHTGRLFRSFGSRIFAMNTSGKSEEPTDFIGTLKDLKYILESSDIVVLSMPLNNDTRGLIGKKQLEWMKQDAILVNVARGEIIRQKDLYEHLRDNPDFKAGLESWWVEPLRHGSFKLEYPLTQLPNVLASPHNSSIVPGVMDQAMEKVVRNVQHYITGKPIKGLLKREDYVK
jgi:phosphoglycerate dehydrogenase-like enzyme